MKATILAATRSLSFWTGVALLAALAGALFQSGGLVELGRASAAYQRQVQHLFSTSLQDIGTGANMAALWTLLSVAFAYGVVHTLGPGHGKTVIAAYFLDGGKAHGWTSGLVAGAWVAVTHTLSALTLAVVLKLMSVAGLFGALSHARWVEMASYGLILAIGLWRLRLGLRGESACCEDHAPAALLRGREGRGEAVTPVRLSRLSCGHGAHQHGPQCFHGLSSYRLVPEPSGTADAGGSVTMVAPPPVSGWRRLLPARSGLLLLSAAGLAPCAGALILVLLALALDVMWAGILGVLAISAGMTVALAGVGTASMLANRLIVSEGRSREIGRLIAVGSSLVVIATGAILLLGVLARVFGWT